MFVFYSSLCISAKREQMGLSPFSAVLGENVKLSPLAFPMPMLKGAYEKGRVTFYTSR